MGTTYTRPVSINEKVSGYCPGCSHGVAQKLIAELIDEMELREKAVGVFPVGCGAMGKTYLNFDVIGPSHGRAPAVATGYKRCAPDRFVFTYQGDGDLGAIGTSEILHAANRGEHFVTIFLNNCTYGMTGGQMAPTTLIGQKTTTTPKGRNAATEGYPLKMCEIISQLEAPVYVARFSLDSAVNIIKAKEGLRKAFQVELDDKGFAFVELLTNCPTNWGMTPVKCSEWIRENSMKTFPLGVFKEV